MNDTDARLWHPWLRINRVLRVMLHTRWSAEASSVVGAESTKYSAALAKTTSSVGPTPWIRAGRRPSDRQENSEACSRRESEKADRTPHPGDKLQIGDRLTDETREYEVIGRAYTTKAGKDVHVRVQRVDNAEITMIRTWGAHERVAVRRA
jgi:hypothetical protein